MEEIKPRRGRDYGSRRDYDVRPRPRTVNDTAPPPQTTPPPQPNQPKKSRRKLLVIGACIAIIITAIGVVGWLFVRRDQGPLPKNVVESVDFPLYYPSSLPKGYILDKNNIKTSGGIVSYILKAGQDSKSITVSEQANPEGFNVGAFTRSAFKQTAPLTIGTSYDLSTNKKSTYMIITDNNVLIFVNSPSKLNGNVVQPVINHMKLITADAKS